MKIDPHLTVVKGLESADAVRKRRLRPSQSSQDGVVILISQENRRAWQTTPTSLKEAKKVLERVQGRLNNAREEVLAEVHHLEAQCLVKLR